jgi:hypothetical protein
MFLIKLNVLPIFLAYLAMFKEQHAPKCEDEGSDGD